MEANRRDRTDNTQERDRVIASLERITQIEAEAENARRAARLQTKEAILKQISERESQRVAEKASVKIEARKAQQEEQRKYQAKLRSEIAELEAMKPAQFKNISLVSTKSRLF